METRAQTIQRLRKRDGTTEEFSYSREPGFLDLSAERQAAREFRRAEVEDRRNERARRARRAWWIKCFTVVAAISTVAGFLLAQRGGG